MERKIMLSPVRKGKDGLLVESLGSGIPRILQAYGEESFRFSENFIRIILPVSVQVDD